MLDVHAPEHPIHGRREFFLHLFTITVGLLIALGLENAAEALHHRHERKEAEANIRQELNTNRTGLLANAPKVKAERDGLVALLGILETRSNGGTIPDGDLPIGFEEVPIPDAAWRTANGNGVLAYMDYGEVEHFADAYKQQDMLQTAEEQALDDYLEFSPIIMSHGDITPEHARDALPYVRHALAHVNGMLALGQGTLDSYNDALK